MAKKMLCHSFACRRFSSGERKCAAPPHTALAIGRRAFLLVAAVSHYMFGGYGRAIRSHHFHRCHHFWPRVERNNVSFRGTFSMPNHHIIKSILNILCGTHKHGSGRRTKWPVSMINVGHNFFCSPLPLLRSVPLSIVVVSVACSECAHYHQTEIEYDCHVRPNNNSSALGERM